MKPTNSNRQHTPHQPTIQEMVNMELAFAGALVKAYVEAKKPVPELLVDTLNDLTAMQNANVKTIRKSFQLTLDQMARDESNKSQLEDKFAPVDNKPTLN